jgi:hypothetical protein
MTNYKDEIFTRAYMHDDAKLYATFHPEVIMKNDHYDTTGRYLVVLLHPTKGLQTFYLNYDDETKTWKQNENSGEIVEEDLIEWCSNQIAAQKNNKPNAA